MLQKLPNYLKEILQKDTATLKLSTVIPTKLQRVFWVWIFQRSVLTDPILDTFTLMQLNHKDFMAIISSGVIPENFAVAFFCSFANLKYFEQVSGLCLIEHFCVWYSNIRTWDHNSDTTIWKWILLIFPLKNPSTRYFLRFQYVNETFCSLMKMMMYLCDFSVIKSNHMSSLSVWCGNPLFDAICNRNFHQKCSKLHLVQMRLKFHRFEGKFYLSNCKNH